MAKNEKYPQKFLDLMNFMFGHEGYEFTNDPDDLGGPTKMGVSIIALKDYYKKRPELGKNWQSITENDVKNISKELAMKIYYEDFYLKSGADKRKDIRDSYLLFDTAVQNSPYTAQEWYKNNGDNFYDVINGRLKHYENQKKIKPSQEKYFEGWQNRLRDVERNANKLIQDPKYKPKYNNSITPFDKGYNGAMQLTEKDLKKSPEELERSRNKYLYIMNNKGLPTGMASSIDEKLANGFTRSDIANMSPEEFTMFEDIINKNIQTGQIQQHMPDIMGYIQQLAPESPIFTKELLNSLSDEDINNYLPNMTNQQQKVGIPYENELLRAIGDATGDVHVKSYTRSDGTKVNAYMRSRPSF